MYYIYTDIVSFCCIFLSLKSFIYWLKIFFKSTVCRYTAITLYTVYSVSDEALFKSKYIYVVSYLLVIKTLYNSCTVAAFLIPLQYLLCFTVIGVRACLSVMEFLLVTLDIS